MKRLSRAVLMCGLGGMLGVIAGCEKEKPRPVAAPRAYSEPLFRVGTATTPAAQTKLLTDALTAWEDQSGGRSLTGLNQLVEKKILDRLPTPPPGQKFVIDTTKHQVVLAAE